ncbi:FecCD family ABC transporter permease [Brevibacterium litoralis]|uniref:FecCD family ABC transporter permease n=1 Tax=Brevibacterium litoralis TaxID=3138935 RepID=UPI0032EE6FF8
MTDTRTAAGATPEDTPPAAPPITSARPRPRRPQHWAGRGFRNPAVGCALGVLVLLLACAASLLLGSRDLSVTQVVAALTGHGTPETAVVTDLRLPRTITGLAAGLAFSLAGVLMQALTRNPLAEPGLLGVNAGSAFAIAIAAGVFGFGSSAAFLPFAFGGALLASLLVLAVGGVLGRGAVPARLVLAGVSFGAVLHGVTSMIVLADPAAFDAMRAWQAGSLERSRWHELAPVAPGLALAVVVTLLLARPLNALALGEESARGLGVRTGTLRVLALLCVTVLAGSGTALAGPIGFVGLVVPLVARSFMGPEYRSVALLSLLMGPALVILADVLGRLVLPTGELPVGIVMGFVGAPVLVWLARRTEVAKL